MQWNMDVNQSVGQLPHLSIFSATTEDFLDRSFQGRHFLASAIHTHSQNGQARLFGWKDPELAL